MTDVLVKRPEDTVHSVFDMRAFAASVAPAAVTYALRCEPGIRAEDVSTTPDVIDIRLAAGMRAGFTDSASKHSARTASPLLRPDS